MRTMLNLELGQYGVNCINKGVADHISILKGRRKGRKRGGGRGGKGEEEKGRRGRSYTVIL